jgi:hypothetical protein
MIQHMALGGATIIQMILTVIGDITRWRPRPLSRLSWTTGKRKAGKTCGKKLIWQSMVAYISQECKRYVLMTSFKWVAVEKKQRHDTSCAHFKKLHNLACEARSFCALEIV